MASKKDIAESEATALTKLFCLSCGFHLGVVTPRPFFIKKQGLWDLITVQFEKQIERGFSVAELIELTKEATRLERLVREPKDLTNGLSPSSKRKDSSRNLIDNRTYWHPILQPRRMPVVTLSGDRTVTHVEDGFVASFVPSFTLEQLQEYWEAKIGRLDVKNVGALLYLYEGHGLSCILHSIDKLAILVSQLRDPIKRAHIKPFDLEAFIEQLEEEKGEAEKW